MVLTKAVPGVFVAPTTNPLPINLPAQLFIACPTQNNCGAPCPNPGVPTLSTFIALVPTITVPAGFTTDGLPAGITFQGRPFSDGVLIKFAYAYEQVTHHRKPPSSVPDLGPTREPRPSN